MSRRAAPAPPLARRFLTRKNVLSLALVILLGWMLQMQAWRIKQVWLRFYHRLDLWLAFKWWALALAVSVFGIVAVLAWDWFFYRRLPYARWRVSQDIDTRETNILREATRLRRIRDAFKPGTDRDDSTP